MQIHVHRRRAQPHLDLVRLHETVAGHISSLLSSRCQSQLVFYVVSATACRLHLAFITAAAFISSPSLIHPSVTSKNGRRCKQRAYQLPDDGIEFLTTAAVDVRRMSCCRRRRFCWLAPSDRLQSVMV
jgi:hypothetical protein